MLLIVLRKMVNNRWMMICLLIGSILVTAMVASMPVYSEGILQRLLTGDLENSQETGAFPGTYHMKATLRYIFEGTNRSRAYSLLDEWIRENIRDFDLPLETQSFSVTFGDLAGFPEIQREEEPIERNINLEAYSGFQDHISIVAGRMFSTQPQNGVYEVVVSEKAMKDLGLVLDYVFLLYDRTKFIDQPIRCKVTGVFTYKDPADPYWYQDPNTFNSSFVMDYDLLMRDFMSEPTALITGANWYYAFDYRKIFVKDIANIAKSYEKHLRWASRYSSAIEFNMPASEIIENYAQRERQLTMTLWILMAPVLLMLSFYIFMVSQLIIRHEESEIAVLKSRGASRFQIFKTYALECAVICGIAMAIGPPLGLLFCRILGSSNGFLEFVSRTALPISLGVRAYLYSLYALLLFVVTMLVPAFLSSRLSIVQYQQQAARKEKPAFWKRYFLDILIVGASLYGLYRLRSSRNMFTTAGAEGIEVGIDPLIFLAAALFILGTGLVFLRIYPYIVKLIFNAGKKIWSPVFYSSFIHVGRSGGYEQFLMIFLILTLSIGIFNANAARTINKNMEDRIRYNIGAEITLQEIWGDNEEVLKKEGGYGPVSNVMGVIRRLPYVFFEPDFSKFGKLKGVEEITKVFDRPLVNIRTNIGASTRYGRVMAITPDEFGRIAWFKDGLLSHHWYEYLNLLCDSPMACLVSSNFKDRHKMLKEGDSIYLKWGDNHTLECVIYGFIDYWPTYYPNKLRGLPTDEVLVVANFDYVLSQTILEPYQIWMKKKPGVNDVTINEELKSGKFDMYFVKYADQEIIKRKNDPMLLGTNGSLTLGFVVAMLICAVGFIIYWVLSIQKRTFQFGIFRAMGLPLRKVLGMILCEQVLISGVAILTGIIIGGVASDLFVPVFQLVSSGKEQVPPFEVVAFREDYLRIYAVVAAILMAGIIVLGRFISSLKMDQAVKLGED